MVYLLQVTVYTALLYTIYLLALKNRAAHNIARAYLVASAIVPLIIPFITIPSFSGSLPANAGVAGISLQEITIASGNINNGSSWPYALTVVYLSGVLFLLIRTGMQMHSFSRFIKQYAQEDINGVKVLRNTAASPGSFFNYIFLPANNADADIYDHELAHIRLKHSYDIILMRLLQVVLWPNVLLYIIGKELTIVHEFQADAYAAKDKPTYITTLLNDTFSTDRFALSHTFFYHPLKRRIMMLHKYPMSRTGLRLTALKTGLSAALLLSGIIYLQSCKPQKETDLKAGGITKVMVDTIHEDADYLDIRRVAEVMPKPAFDLPQYLGKTIKYPKLAQEKGTEYRVVVEFLVNADGSVSRVKPRNMNDSLLKIDAYKALADEAVRVVSAMPAWTPGEQDGKKVAVLFYQPILFKLK